MAWEGIESFCGSKFWDANLTWHTTSPEFTPCFEQTALVWLPIVFLWIFIPFDIFITQNNKSLPIGWNHYNVSKIVANSLLIFLVTFDLGYNVSGIVEIYPRAYWTPIAQISAYIMTLLMSMYHLKKGQCTSGCLFVFWGLSVILNAHAFRSDIRSFQNQTYTAINISDSISYIIKLFLLVLNFFADMVPEDPDVVNKDKVVPLHSSSALSRFTVSWYDKLAFLGFRRPLIITDFWDLDKKMTTKYLVETFEYYWNKKMKQRKLKGKKANVSALTSSMKGVFYDYIVCATLRFLSDLLAFASPLLLRQMIAFVKTDDSDWKGYMLAIAMIATSVVQSCLSANAQLHLYCFGIKYKTAIMGSIYKKSLVLSNNARSETSFGEVVNIMAIDCEKLIEMVYYMQFAFLAPLQLIITFILLYQMMGVAILAGFSIMFILLPVNWYFSKRIHAIQTEQMKTKDSRIKSINEILSGIKVLKLNAWEPTFGDRINNLRGNETDSLKKMAYLSSTMSCFWSCATCFMLLSTFAVFVLSDENNVLDAETAFTSIALFNILYMTMFLVPHFINYFSQAKVSIARINKYMNAEEINTSSVTHHHESDQLIMEKCSFSWEDENRLTLKNINLRIKPGSLVAVVGPVGCGKSSLMSAFLGEMNKISGRVNTMGTIAYVPQVAWIQNDTVKGNILFGKTFSSTKYKRIVESCSLSDDFEMLPGGDMTEIGEKGINLSGGQKQRVSLARAVYFDSEVYFLDDPLSAVDSLVGKHIFEHVIGPRGLLRKKTRLLATHLVSYLPDVDYVIVMKDGTISAMGTYKELMSTNNSFKEFIQNHSQDHNNYDEQDLECDNESETSSLVGHRRDSSATTGRKSISSVNTSRLSLEKDDNINSNGGLVQEEKTEIGQVNLGVIKNYVKAMGVQWGLMIFAFCFIRQGFAIGGNYWISVWSNDETLRTNGNGTESKRDMYLGVYGVLIFSQAISSYLSDLIPLMACLKAAMFLHSTLLKSVLRAPLAFFDTTPLGRIIARFSKDVDSLDSSLPLVMTQTVNFFFELLGIIFVISYSSPIFLLVMIPIAVFFYFIRKFYILSSTQIRRLVAVSRSPIYSHFSETLSGAFVIRAFREQDRFIKESQSRIDANTKAYYTSTVANRWLSVRLETLGNIVIFFAAVSAVLTRGDENVGVIGMSLTYSLMITRVLLFLMRWSAETELNIVAAERIKEYCDIPQEKPWELPVDVPKNWPDKGEVIFKDFSFRYREGLDLVLKNVSFSIQPGEKVGIVGRSGAGKSSLTLSLFRIIESAGGNILIDGIDISTLGLHRLRQSLNIISQDPVLFSGSLRLNFDPENKHSDTEIWKAVELAHLKAYVSTLPQGLQYEVVEDGSNLSVGQRQQVCLARALLSKTKILIMDEATAAIDLETDDLIQKTIRSEFSSCTVLTIAHRINTIMDSDRVLVMDNGAVAEFDTPKTLMSNSDSIFASLAKQAGIDSI